MIFVIMPAGNAQALGDLSAPVLVSSTVTPKTLNLVTGPSTVKVTIRVTDQTGTTPPIAFLGQESTGQTQGLAAMTLISGTVKDGIWERSITLPKGAASGEWEAIIFPLSDKLGNTSSAFKTLTTIKVSGNASDISAPVLVSVTVTPKTLNLATGPTTVKVTVRVTDKTGVAAPIAYLAHDAADQPQGLGRLTLVSGTVKDGTWQRSMSIPRGAALGQWKAVLFPLGDTLGNSDNAFRTLATITAVRTLTSTPTPKITGKAKVASTLTAVPGTWAPSPVTVKYQWFRSGIAIKGATAKTYKLTAADAGKYIAVRTTGSKAGYTSATKSSSATAKISR